MAGIGFGMLLHKHKKPVIKGDDPLATGGLTNTDYRASHPDPSQAPYSPNHYEDANQWPVSMGPMPASAGSAAPSGLGSIGGFGSATPMTSVLPNEIPSVPMPTYSNIGAGTVTPPVAQNTPAVAAKPAVTSAVAKPASAGGYKPVGGFNDLYQDEKGNDTYSKNADENKQYGYWGSAMGGIEDNPGGPTGLASVGGGQNGAMRLANASAGASRIPKSIL